MPRQDRQEAKQTINKRKETALIPYTKSTNEKIGRILNQHKIESIHTPINKMSMVRSEKGKIPLERHGKYEMS